MNQKQLSDIQAYAAMFAFLEYHYEISKSDDLGSLLGSMSLLKDGTTADPAIWKEWQDAIAKALGNQVALQLNLT